MFRKTVLSASVHLLALAGRGQGADFRRMPAEERQAYLQKINTASYQDRKQMLDRLGIVLPVLPNDLLDPARPPHTVKLIALVAPRPVFITGGTQERWIDTEGEFLACVAAGPVYELLGKKGLGATRIPLPDIALVEGELAFRNHTGSHVDLPNSPAFLQWAPRYFK